MPLSLVFTPDAYYFGVLPVLAETTTALGGDPAEVARAAILGQMTTGFPVSPLTPSTFLLVGLTGVDLADGESTASINVDLEYVDVTTFNVLADTTTGRTDRTVVSMSSCGEVTGAGGSTAGGNVASRCWRHFSQM